MLSASPRPPAGVLLTASVSVRAHLIIGERAHSLTHTQGASRALSPRDFSASHSLRNFSRYLPQALASPTSRKLAGPPAPPLPLYTAIVRLSG